MSPVFGQLPPSLELACQKETGVRTAPSIIGACLSEGALCSDSSHHFWSLPVRRETVFGLLPPFLELSCQVETCVRTAPSIIGTCLSEGDLCSDSSLHNWSLLVRRRPVFGQLPPFWSLPVRRSPAFGPPPSYLAPPCPNEASILTAPTIFEACPV